MRGRLFITADDFSLAGMDFTLTREVKLPEGVREIRYDLRYALFWEEYWLCYEEEVSLEGRDPWRALVHPRADRFRVRSLVRFDGYEVNQGLEEELFEGDEIVARIALPNYEKWLIKELNRP